MIRTVKNRFFICLVIVAMLPAVNGCRAHFDTARSTVVMAGADISYSEGNYEAAADSYKKAAGMNNPKAHYLLGRMYAKGEGIPRSDEQALYWMTQAADREYPPADVDIGLRYLFGEGVPANQERALFHFQRAADNEYALAMYYMGIMNARGWGAPANKTEALRWFRNARACGYPVEKNLLTGEGISDFMAAETASSTPPLLDVSNSADAAAIQARLAELGFYRMKIDGKWGAGSKKVLRAFQKSRGLDADGEWTMQSQIKLFPGAGR
ncbi:MAG: hypothetical protein AVO39_05215 [delta proteobacterium MLS_D]|jgi:uncharacterized protein|nr:MAG: hypothetical protein AVO39_05215 [delta proteobacterium MLS_D]